MGEATFSIHHEGRLISFEGMGCTVKMNEPYRKKTLYMQRKRQKDAPSVDIAPDSTCGEARVKCKAARSARPA